MAYIQRESNGYYLAITDLDEARVIHMNKLSVNYPYSLTWLNNRRLMFSLTGKIFAVNADGSGIKVLANHLTGDEKIRNFRSLMKKLKFWQVVNRLDEDREHILASSFGTKGYSGIFKVNIYTGDMEEIYSGKAHKITDWVLNTKGEAVLAVRKDDDEVSFFSYDATNDDITALEKMSNISFDFGRRFIPENRKFLCRSFW